MKRWLIFAMLLTLILSLAIGCSSGKSKYKDGEFDAVGDIDENGYKGTISIHIKDGKISSVNYDEITKDGEKKSEDESYAGIMQDVSGIKPAEAYEQMENALVKTQDPDKIDAVTGATGSSETFKKLAKEALGKAK